MTRIRLVAPDQAPLLARPFFVNGAPGPIEASLATVPELLDVAAPFFAAVLGPGAVPNRLKEIVIVRTSALQGCRYCVDAHSVVAIDTGLSVEEVLALRGEVDVEVSFGDPAERAALAWVDRVAGSTGAIVDDVAHELSRHFEDHLVVELTLLIGATMLLNRYCTALELPTAPSTRVRLAEAGLS